MNSIISNIKNLQKKRILLNSIRKIPSCALLRDYYDNKKNTLIDNLLFSIAQKSELLKKYKDIDIKTLNPIGEKVWMFWYTGFEAAPPIVKKCVSIIKNIKDVDLILIDKTNLEKYFYFEGNIEKYFYSGEISIQTFSDILRCQLLSKRGGFWFDSTLFVINKNFIHEHKDLSYWSIKHSANDLLLKQKWNEYFTKGLWSIYGCGAGKDNPLFSFIYDMYLSYFELYNISFDYFQTDYTWLFAYTHFDWAKELVDNITPCVSCSYYIGQHLKKVFNKSNWDMILRENSFQKLNWRIECKKSKKQTYYDYFINSYQNND